jgi:hypothetical protein
MDIYSLRRLTRKNAPIEANEHLGLTLAFVAGATNAGYSRMSWRMTGDGVRSCAAHSSKNFFF